MITSVSDYLTREIPPRLRDSLNIFQLLQKVRDVSSGAPGPRHSDRVHLEGRSHHVQGVALALAAADLLRVVIHSETREDLRRV